MRPNRRLLLCASLAGVLLVSSNKSALAAATQPETVGVLMVDAKGDSKIVCLPQRTEQDHVFPKIKLSKILDATSHQGTLWVAALAESPNGKLVLLSPGKPARMLAKGARFARFSPNGDALLFETLARKHVGGGVIADIAKSQRFDLANGKTTPLGDFQDPRWEADSQHVRGTALVRKLQDRGTHVTAQTSGNRVRWDTTSGQATVLGPGSSQIPAPRGLAVAWSDEPPLSALSDRCKLSLGDKPVQQIPASGSVCQGQADDRGIRWSPDGRWLAFASFASSPSNPLGAGQPLFVEILSTTGERHPSMPGLLAASGGSKTNAAPRAATAFPWLDWSPSQRRLVAQDDDDNIYMYDLVNPGITSLGKGKSPTWSPKVDYLLLRTLETSEAFVLPGGQPTDKLSLGKPKSIHWLPATACAR